jgi:SAM-dependent methyltransferase
MLAGFLKSALAKRGRSRVLHFAPEVCLTKIMMGVPGVDYLSIDIEPEFALMVGDICDLQFKDGEFDVVLCSHVLEHVSDDRKAMREIRRVLKSDGVAYVMVPQDLERPDTFEDPSITSEEEREKAFGQYDHVRLYGRDFVDRLREAGFAVETLKTADIADEKTILENDLHPDLVYVCKPQ